MPTAMFQVPLSAAAYPIWGVTLYLQPGTTFQYKFIRKETNGTVRGYFCLTSFSLSTRLRLCGSPIRTVS